MSITAVIIDDEQRAVEGLSQLLEAHAENVRIAGSALSGAEAIAVIERTRPDVLFIDIHLGDMSGFDVLNALSYSPGVVFVTAYDAYAVKAFKYAALDYLLKPIEPERLRLSIERILDHCSRGPSAAVLHKLSKALNKGPLSRISSRIGNQRHIVHVADINYIEAQGYCASVYIGDRQFPVRIALREFEERLSDYFMRVHRKYIVNTTRIKSLHASPWGQYSVIMNNPPGKKLPVSRGRLAALRKYLSDTVA